MKTVQFREAICEAMSEEMRRDDSVYLMGEEVAEYQGAYKVTQGLLDEFGPKRVIDTPITEQGFAGLGVGAAFGELRPVQALAEKVQLGETSSTAILTQGAIERGLACLERFKQLIDSTAPAKLRIVGTNGMRQERLGLK